MADPKRSKLTASEPRGDGTITGVRTPILPLNRKHGARRIVTEILWNAWQKLRGWSAGVPIIAALLLLGACAGEGNNSISQEQRTTPTPTPLAADTRSTPTPTQSPAAEAAKESPRAKPKPKQVELEIAVWDDTRRNPADVEIWVRGSGSWYPDISFGADKRSFGMYPVGRKFEFFVYPDGRGAREIRVEFRMTEDMISGSTQALTNIDIHDRRVVVHGQAIEGFERQYPR